MASTSTAALPGRPATPTAVLACQPASPKQAMNSSVAPLMTCGFAPRLGLAVLAPHERQHAVYTVQIALEGLFPHEI